MNSHTKDCLIKVLDAIVDPDVSRIDTEIALEELKRALEHDETIKEPR